MLGEFADGMPHHVPPPGADHLTTAQSSGEAPCPDHESNGNTADDMQTNLPDAATHHGSSHQENCCKTTCGCPCLHVSAMATPQLLTDDVLLQQQRPPVLVVGATPQRISLLLRPPA
jgi:hypothetical protein